MKITRELRKQLTAAVRTHGLGGRLAEVGYRDDGNGRKTNNALTWPADSDLWDTSRLSDLKTLDDDPDNPGYHSLDLYVYSTHGAGKYRTHELETNVYVFIKDGAIVLATNRDLAAKRLAAELGFPKGKGW